MKINKLYLTFLGSIAIAVIVSGHEDHEDSSLQDLTTSRLGRSPEREKARKSRTSRRGKKERKEKKVKKGATRNMIKIKNKGNKEAKGKGKGKGEGKKNNNKSERSRKTSNNRIESLTIARIRDYRRAFNQKKKAIRVKSWIKSLGKKVNNSRTFFIEAAEFFKDCPEGLSIYQHLR